MADPVHDYLAEIGRKGGAAGRSPAKGCNPILQFSAPVLVVGLDFRHMGPPFGPV